MYFEYDSELAKKFYLEYYANINQTMRLCFPVILIQSDVQSNMTKYDDVSGLRCFYFGGYSYLQGTWKFIWKTNTLGLSCVFSAAILIILTGLTGWCHSLCFL